MQPENQLRFVSEIEPLFDNVFGYAKHLTKDEFRAKDLTAEVMMKAFKSIESLQKGTNARAWVLRITYNTFLNLRRSEKRWSPQEDMTPFEDDLAQHSSNQVWLESEEEMLDTDQFGDALHYALSQLNPQQLTLAYLVLLSDCPYREAGETLGVHEDVIRTRVFRLRKKLKASLADFASAELGVQ